MTFPQLKLRTLVLAVLFIAMALAIGVLSVQNQRLRAQAMRERAERLKAEKNRRTLAPYLRFGLAYMADHTKPLPVQSGAPGGEM